MLYVNAVPTVPVALPLVMLGVGVGVGGGALANAGIAMADKAKQINIFKDVFIFWILLSLGVEEDYLDGRDSRAQDD
jgi:hypothetical protein